MEQNEITTQTQLTQLPSAPVSLARRDIADWLQKLGINGICTTEELARKLGSMSIRLLRQKIKEGELRPMDRSAKVYVFKLDDICDFLMKHPIYAVRKVRTLTELTPERFNQLVKTIKEIAYHHFRNSILAHIDIDDAVSEVLLLISRSKAKWNAPDFQVVYRMLTKVSRKFKDKPRWVSTDPNDFCNEADENIKDPKDID